MSRSGYSDDCEYLELYRASVTRAIRGKRGQVFLKELARTLDAMPEKSLIAGELMNSDGEVCAIGSVCKSRGIDVSQVESYDPTSVASAVGIARCLAAEIEFINDDDFSARGQSPEQRWTRVRKWVEDNLPDDPEP